MKSTTYGKVAVKYTTYKWEQNKTVNFKPYSINNAPLDIFQISKINQECGQITLWWRVTRTLHSLLIKATLIFFKMFNICCYINWQQTKDYSTTHICTNQIRIKSITVTQTDPTDRTTHTTFQNYEENNKTLEKVCPRKLFSVTL